MTSTVIPIDTLQGPGRFFVDLAEQPSSTLVLGHGAGGGIGALDLELLAQSLPALGTTVVRFEQPWRTAGRTVGAPPPKLDEAWCAALDWLVTQEWVRHPLLVGGRSAGARVACRTASHTNPAAIVCLAFPLHLPGRPEKSRLAELLAPTVPRLILQGSKDSFGTAEEIRAAIGNARGISVVELPGADHAYRIAKSSAFSAADLRSTVVAEVQPIHRRSGGNIDIMTALHLICPYWWMVGTSSRCCVPRRYSRT